MSEVLEGQSVDMVDSAEAEIQALEVVQARELEALQPLDPRVVAHPQGLKVGVPAEHPAVDPS